MVAVSGGNVRLLVGNVIPTETYVGFICSLQSPRQRSTCFGYLSQRMREEFEIEQVSGCLE